MARQPRKRYERTTLTNAQVAVLDLIYKYRFVSRQLLAESMQSKAGSSLHERLEVLVKHGYVGKRLDKKLKLLGTPAAYFVTPQGLRALRDRPGHEVIPDTAIKTAYKDSTVSQAFINHTLDVYRATLLLQRQYPALKVFMPRDMARYSYFLTPPPDAFLSLPSLKPEQPKRYFFDVVPDMTPRYVLEQRIAKYCTFFEEGGWKPTRSKLPSLLLIAESGTGERRARRAVVAQLNRAENAELRVGTSTSAALAHLTAANTAIWNDGEDDELLSLPELN